MLTRTRRTPPWITVLTTPHARGCTGQVESGESVSARRSLRIERGLDCDGFCHPVSPSSHTACSFRGSGPLSIGQHSSLQRRAVCSLWPAVCVPDGSSKPEAHRPMSPLQALCRLGREPEASRSSGYCRCSGRPHQPGECSDERACWCCMLRHALALCCRAGFPRTDQTTARHRNTPNAVSRSSRPIARRCR